MSRRSLALVAMIAAVLGTVIVYARTPEDSAALFAGIALGAVYAYALDAWIVSRGSDTEESKGQR